MHLARSIARCAIVLALACPVSAFAVGHERIPLDHWSYLALERFESLGLCVLPDDRPFTRDEIIAIAEKIETAADATTLSAKDRYELDRLQQEFTSTEARENPASRYDAVWYGSDRAIALEGDLLLLPYLPQLNSSTEVEGFVGLTPEFRAHLGDRFTYDVRYQLLYGPEHGDRARNQKPSRREKSFKGLTSNFERSYING